VRTAIRSWGCRLTVVAAALLAAGCASDGSSGSRAANFPPKPLTTAQAQERVNWTACLQQHGLGLSATSTPAPVRAGDILTAVAKARSQCGSIDASRARQPVETDYAHCLNRNGLKAPDSGLIKYLNNLDTRDTRISASLGRCGPVLFE
jgi:hypothetical protein